MSLWRPSHKWQYNIRIICKNTRGTKLDLSGSVESQTVGSSENSNGLPVTKKGGKLLTNYVTVSISKGLSPCG